jgi:prepilin-type processing-associated H-X9-DG protein
MRSFSSKPLGWGVYQLAQVPNTGAAFYNARSMSQLKQLALAALQFTQDWNNIFAFDIEFAEDALRPYMRDNSLWFVAHTGQHFKFNSRLSGVSAGALQDPANTVLFYDGADEQPVFRYDNLCPICFADGHVKLFDAEGAKKLRWQP